uniref:Uncharacterized protein n=1 Tax=Mycena chlorophos TaxID=658473 RepID=A0ABQ0L340_MYCCL|nr:predicted protein [Mycena chlorophos]
MPNRTRQPDSDVGANDNDEYGDRTHDANDREVINEAGEQEGRGEKHTYVTLITPLASRFHPASPTHALCASTLTHTMATAEMENETDSAGPGLACRREDACAKAQTRRRHLAGLDGTRICEESVVLALPAVVYELPASICARGKVEAEGLVLLRTPLAAAADGAGLRLGLPRPIGRADSLAEAHARVDVPRLGERRAGGHDGGLRAAGLDMRPGKWKRTAGCSLDAARPKHRHTPHDTIRAHAYTRIGRLSCLDRLDDDTFRIDFVRRGGYSAAEWGGLLGGRWGRSWWKLHAAGREFGDARLIAGVLDVGQGDEGREDDGADMDDYRGQSIIEEIDGNFDTVRPVGAPESSFVRSGLELMQDKPASAFLFLVGTVEQLKKMQKPAPVSGLSSPFRGRQCHADEFSSDSY